MQEPSLFEYAPVEAEPVLPEGVTILREFVPREGQLALVEESRRIAAVSPLVKPKTRSGFNFSLSVTGVGDAVWFSDAQRGYHYAKRHPETNREWEKIPRLFLRIARLAAEEVGLLKFKPDTCLINFYPKETGRLGLHVDNTEEDLVSPIVTVSLGDTCKFLVGGLARQDKTVRVQLKSGDVCVMHRAGRMLYHGVDGLIPGSSDLLRSGGRISLTLRRNKPVESNSRSWTFGS